MNTIHRAYILLLLLLVLLMPTLIWNAQANLFALSWLKLGITDANYIIQDSALSKIETSSFPRLKQHLVVIWLCELRDVAGCDIVYHNLQVADIDDPLLQFRLANFMAARGNSTEAIKLWNMADSARYWAFQGMEESGCICNIGTEGYCYLQRASQIAPTDSLVRFYLGQQQITCEQWEAAYKNLTAVLDSDQLSDLNRHEALVDRAEAVFQTGRGLDMARNDVVAAIALQPNNPWSRLRLCSLYRRHQDYGVALEVCNEALSLAPELGNAYYYRGRVWHDQGDLVRAATDYEQALSLTPELRVAEEWLRKIKLPQE